MESWLSIEERKNIQKTYENPHFDFTQKVFLHCTYILWTSEKIVKSQKRLRHVLKTQVFRIFDLAFGVVHVSFGLSFSRLRSHDMRTVKNCGGANGLNVAA